MEKRGYLLSSRAIFYSPLLSLAAPGLAPIPFQVSCFWCVPSTRVISHLHFTHDTRTHFLSQQRPSRVNRPLLSSWWTSATATFYVRACLEMKLSSAVPITPSTALTFRREPRRGNFTDHVRRQQMPGIKSGYLSFPTPHSGTSSPEH